jgi:hypothetical protein
MKKGLLTLLFSVSLLMSASTASAKEDRPYMEGPVTFVTYVRTHCCPVKGLADFCNSLLICG